MFRKLVILLLFLPTLSVANFTPNEPLVDHQWYLDKIKAKGAWSITKGSATVKIAIIDGSSLDHPDINWAYNLSQFLFGPFYQGYDALTQTEGAERYINIPSTSEYYNYWHALHVAAIAGSPFNNQGVAGICPNCSIVPVNITNSQGKPDESLVAEGIDWAIRNNVDVINLSLSSANGMCGYLPMTDSRYPIKKKIEEAISKGIVVVAAAGNFGGIGSRSFPGSCQGVINVAATQKNNRIASYSASGSGITIAAPGGNRVGFGGQYFSSGSDYCTTLYPGVSANFVDDEGILSAWANIADGHPQTCYRYLGGTSMSAPMVSGTVGLMLSRNKNLSPQKINNILIQSATIGNGVRLLNAQAAVTAVASSTTGPCSLSSGQGCVIDAITEYRNASGAVDKFIYANSHKWHLNGNNVLTKRPSRLSANSAYNQPNGPCGEVSGGVNCKLDTVTTVNTPGSGYVKSITAYGKGWNYDASGSLWPQNPFNLVDIPRYANGPCSYAGIYVCKFDTRVLVDLPGLGMVEAITAHGHYFMYTYSGALIETGNIRDVSRWANGPCANVGINDDCEFNARNVTVNSSGQILETIIAYGRLYEWRDGSLIKNVSLTSDSTFK